MLAHIDTHTQAVPPQAHKDTHRHTETARDTDTDRFRHGQRRIDTHAHADARGLVEQTNPHRHTCTHTCTHIGNTTAGARIHTLTYRDMHLSTTQIH